MIRNGMTGERQTYGDDRKVVVIQSKITPADDARLNRVVKKYGFTSRYEVLQYLVSAFLHYADPSGECMTDEGAAIGSIFQGCESPLSRLNAIRHDKDMEETDVIRIMKSADAEAYSVRWTHHTVDGDTDSSSAPHVLQLVLARLLPDRYEYLMKIAGELDSISVLRALDHLIEADKRCGTPDTAEYASNTYGIVPVRKHHKTIR